MPRAFVQIYLRFATTAATFSPDGRVFLHRLLYFLFHLCRMYMYENVYTNARIFTHALDDLRMREAVKNYESTNVCMPHAQSDE